MTTTTKYDFDFFVIGAGSGGVRSARIAANHGAKVAIAEAGAFGGTCVNLGCVPKKLFAYAADFHAAFEDSKGFGWEVSQKPKMNWQTLVENKNAEISRLNGIYISILEKAGVKIVKGFAKFVDENTVEVDGRKFTAKNILIATGGKPRRLDIEGADFVVVSDDMFFLKELPKTALIVGGGYIAVEFAHILSGLGVKVDLMYRGELFLRGFDYDIRRGLAEEMASQGINLKFNYNVIKIEKSDAEFIAHDTNGNEQSYGLVMSAIGRDSALDINLSAAGLSVAKGMLEVDDFYRTKTQNIFAVGDISSKYALTPVAIREGHGVADFLFKDGNPKPDVNYDNLPTAVFSAPPIGTAGLTEEKAREKGIEIEVYKTHFRAMKHTLSGRGEKILMKLVVNKKDDKVIGIHMLGDDAPEVIQALGIAMTAGATKRDFDKTMAVHPTAAEEWVTL